MNEIIFDIKKYSYVSSEEIDVSFIPMLIRRKLDSFGKAGLYTLYGTYDDGCSPNITFASCYGDFDRVVKLIKQRNEEGEVSPSGFSSSVHNATVGLFSLLKKLKKSYNSISAGNKTIPYAFIESIVSGESIFCYTESIGGVKSVSISTIPNPHGKYVLCSNNSNMTPKDTFEDLINFLNGKSDIFVSDLYVVKKNETL